uniref:DUF6880 family protein n=1 Tax=Burkholderia arboris TaxID=488730 RepID=UPI003BEF0376
MIHDDDDELVPERLITLGAGRLADILVECAETNPSLRRRLRAELSAHAATDVIVPIRQWIKDLRDDASFLNARAYRATAHEFEALREAIATQVARVAPLHAPELLWLWFTLAGAIADRTTEECWEIHRSCEQACIDVVRLSVEAGIEPAVLIIQMADAIEVEHADEYGALPRAVVALGSSAPAYLAQFKAALQQLLGAWDANRTRRETLRALQQALS